MKALRIVAAFGAWCLLACSFALVRAQDVTGTISGTVFDPSGAIVPGVTVAIINTDRNVVIRTVITDNGGQYTAPLLPVGHYTVTAEVSGFKKAERKGLMLNVSDKLTVNISLEVGTISETVSVEASALRVDTQTATQAGLINPVEMRELPLNARNYEQLVSLMPGVTSSATSDTLYIGNSLPGGTTNVLTFSFNGARTSSNYWSIDGADNVDRGSNLTLLNYPSVDAIEEFKVQRSQYGAEFGRAGAAQILVVTKSGTRSFHGGAYEFVRNDDLQANNFFNNFTNTARPPLRWNDFGYTFGGPLYIPHVYNEKKDKTFFFFSQELRRVITYGTVNANLPTAAMRSGTFTGPVCISYTTSGTCAATGTSIASINPVAQTYMTDIWNKMPQPNAPSISAYTYIVPLRSTYNADQQLLRIDHTLSPKVALSGRLLHDAIPTQEPGGLFTGAALPGVSTTNTNSPGWNVVLHALSTISPHQLNEIGFQYSYGAIVSDPVGLDGSAQSPDVHPSLPFPSTLGRIPSLSITGISGVAGYGPYRDYNRNYNAFVNQTWLHRNHTLKFGFSYNHYQKTENTGGNNVGSYTVSNAGQSGPDTTQMGWANFLLGRVATFSQASIDITPDIRTQQFEMFAQDDFHLRHNLTINFGLRYSMYRQPTDVMGMLTNFSAGAYNSAKAPALTSTGNICTTAPCFNGASPNSSYDPLNGIIVNGSTSPYGMHVSNNDNKNFAPRFGFAWDPSGNGKMSIRGGYGVFYDTTLFGIVEQNIFTNLPYVKTLSISNTTLDNPGGGTVNVSASPVSLRGIPIPYSTPYIQDWSFGVQMDVYGGWFADVSYVGNKGTHLLGYEDFNQPKPGAYVAAGLSTTTSAGYVVPGTGGSQNENLLNLVRPYQGYGPINVIATRFNSNYNGLQAELQKQFSGSSVVKADYTWSKALTDNQTDRSTAPQNIYDIHSDYGPLQQDRTHVLSVDFVYNLPWYKNQERLLGHILGGWQLSGIVSAASGLPLTVTSALGLDPAGQGVNLSTSAAGYRPDLVADPNANAPHTLTNWFNGLAFANVTPGQTRPGTEGRGAVRGPGLQKWDLSLSKFIRMTERANFQIRAEAFNIWNHTNFQGVGTSLGSSTYNRITSARDARVAQIGLKLNF